MGDVIQAAHRFEMWAVLRPDGSLRYRIPLELRMPPPKSKRRRGRKFRFARPERCIDWDSPLLLAFHGPVPPPTIDPQDELLTLPVESVPVIWGKPPLKLD